MLRSGYCRRFVAVTLVVLLHPMIATAQTSSADVAKKSTEAWDTLKAFGVEKRQEAVEFGRGLLKETDGKISQLKENTAKLSGEVKARYEKDVQVLNPVRERAGSELDKMKKASSSAWESTKKGFADAYKELQQAYDKTAERFR